ncbi:hypothetical protein [Nostoc sp. CCY0012]|uniref:hypothetical protein n=1 Tax=Nostoc sp. CCY0012 TaxID=1056123 RepID=UPI0039C67197
MNQEQGKPIDLSVHETSYPSKSRPHQEAEVIDEINDLNDAVHDDENVDAEKSEPFDTGSEQTLADRQITIANLSAS